MKKRKKFNGHVPVSKRFITALSILSIIGFAAVISKNIFNFNLDLYTEAALLIIVGVGLVIEARIKKLKSLTRGLTSNNLTHLTTIIVGVIAIIAGILSVPPIRLESPVFMAVKGLISVIAIVVIFIQTWWTR